MNRYHMPRLWGLNAFDVATMPKYVPDLAQRADLDVLSNTILRLSQSGMPLFPDADLENWIRDAVGLPDLGEDAAETRDIMQDVPSGEDAKAMPQKPASAGQQKRDTLKKAIKGSIARRAKYYGGSAT